MGTTLKELIDEGTIIAPRKIVDYINTKKKIKEDMRQKIRQENRRLNSKLKNRATINGLDFRGLTKLSNITINKKINKKDKINEVKFKRRKEIEKKRETKFELDIKRAKQKITEYNKKLEKNMKEIRQPKIKIIKDKKIRQEGRKIFYKEGLNKIYLFNDLKASEKEVEVPNKDGEMEKALLIFPGGMRYHFVKCEFYKINWRKEELSTCVWFRCKLYKNEFTNIHFHIDIRGDFDIVYNGMKRGSTYVALNKLNLSGCMFELKQIFYNCRFKLIDFEEHMPHENRWRKGAKVLFNACKMVQCYIHPQWKFDNFCPNKLEFKFDESRQRCKKVIQQAHIELKNRKNKNYKKNKLKSPSTTKEKKKNHKNGRSAPLKARTISGPSMGQSSKRRSAGRDLQSKHRAKGAEKRDRENDGTDF